MSEVACPNCSETWNEPNAWKFAEGTLLRCEVCETEFDFERGAQARKLMKSAKAKEAIKVLEEPISASEPQGYVRPEASDTPALKTCQFCQSKINESTQKCPNCAEWLVPAKEIEFSPPLAGFFSFIIPGMGQLYKERPLAAAVWFLATFIGYACFIIPGLVLHFLCFVDAVTGSARKTR